MNNKFPEVLVPFLRYYLLKTKVMSKKPKILGMELRSKLLEVSYILKNGDNTSPGMNNEFVGVVSPILRYYMPRTKVMSKKPKILRIEQ